jgi:hypothetical protein
MGFLLQIGTGRLDAPSPPERGERSTNMQHAAAPYAPGCVERPGARLTIRASLVGSDHVKQVSEQAQAREKIVAESSKNDSET